MQFVRSLLYYTAMMNTVIDELVILMDCFFPTRRWLGKRGGGFIITMYIYDVMLCNIMGVALKA